MIKTFRNKALNELWATSKAAKIDVKFHKRILVRLGRLDAVDSVKDMDQPGYDFHSLKGFSPTRYSIHVNGPWCITFEFDGGDAYRLDFEQYH